MEQPIFQYPNTPETCCNDTINENNIFCHFGLGGSSTPTSTESSRTEGLWKIQGVHLPGRSPTPPSTTTTANHPEMKSATKLLATEMNNLSLQEREKVYEDVHGVSESVKETDELVAKSLFELEDVLSHKATPSSAYKIAEQMSKEFVHDTKLRLMFLRASCFDTKQAATQFIRFFHWKLQYFGLDKLTTKITLDDLDDDALGCLKSGRCQFLPVRDQGGRAIHFCIQQRIYKYQTVEAMMRFCWYQVMAAMEDEETQRNGIVVINYIVGSDGIDASDHQLMIHGTRFTQYMPFRMTGMHMCFDHSKLMSLAGLIMNNVDMNSRIRARIHEGSHTECQFGLMTFGIPVDVLPVSTDGKIKTTNHMKWIECRRIKEKEIEDGKVFNGLDLPTRYDVLLGRGKPIQDHPGNVYFRQLIESQKEEYEMAGRGEKNIVAKSIVEHIQSRRGRFLRQEGNGWWYEVSDTVSREKVCSLFRKIVMKPRQLPSSVHDNDNNKTYSSSSSNTGAKRIKT